MDQNFAASLSLDGGGGGGGGGSHTWLSLSLSLYLSLLVISLLGRNEDLSEAAAEAMVGALERLIDPDQMGARYKALAIASGDMSGEPGGQAADPPPGGFEY